MRLSTGAGCRCLSVLWGIPDFIVGIEDSRDYAPGPASIFGTPDVWISVILPRDLAVIARGVTPIAALG